jgi:nucleoredoxin
MLRLLFLFAIAFALTAVAAPMTVKEIDFLLRQHTPETEIATELAQRRLLAPLDPAGETQLLEHGATPSLIVTLQQSRFILSPAEAQAFALRTAPAKTALVQPPVKAATPAPAPAPVAAVPAAPRQSVLDQLGGKLVRLEGDEIKPVDAQSLRNIRLFAIYNSALWCGPCRKFTPQLVAAYKLLKVKHPDFEVLFLSSDHDENGMATYMRTDRMPFPAMRFGTQTEVQQLYCGHSIPWLVLVAANGQPLTKNGVDKQFIAPDQILGAVETLLAQMP